MYVVYENMKNDSDEYYGRDEDAGDGSNGTERTSKTASGNTRVSTKSQVGRPSSSHSVSTKSQVGRPSSSHSVSRSKRKLTTRSGKTTEPMQQHLPHSGRGKVSSQVPARIGTPVKSVQVHLTKLTLSPGAKSGRKLSAKKYLAKVRQEQHHARARRSRKMSPTHSPEGITLTGSGPSPRTKTIIEKLVAQRPRRTVTPKNLDYTAGLSWQEEKELKKALYVSLQESRRSQSCTDSPMPDSGSDEHMPDSGNGRRGRKPASAALGINPMMPPHTGNSGQSTPDTLREGNGNGNSMSSVVDSVSSQASSQCKLMKAQVRAQRKFAQGSRPVSPCVTPRKPKSASTPKKQPLPNVMPKTEDFLTFLCLRGSSVLPPNLEFFNYTDSESHMSFPNTPRHSQDGSQPATPLSGGDTPRNGRAGGGTPRGRSPAPQSRPSSPDREIAALGEELGVSPLPRDDAAAVRARRRFKTASTLKSTRLKSHITLHSSSTAKHSTLGRAVTHHMRKTATVAGRPSGMRTPLRETKGKGGNGGETGGLSWHEKLLMRRARNAAASRNRRRLKKLGVLTRSKRRTLETQARTTENEAAAAALQANPQIAVPSSTPQAVSGNTGMTKPSKGVARRRPGPRRVLADAEIDSEPPYIAVVNMEDSPTVEGRSSKPRTADQRTARTRHYQDSLGGSIMEDRKKHRRRKVLRRKESCENSIEKGRPHRGEGGSSIIATKTRSRSSTRSAERSTRQHYSRDIASTRDSRAKRRSTTSVNRELKVAQRKDSRMSRAEDNEPSGSGDPQKAAEGNSPSEGSRKKSKGRLPASPPHKIPVIPRVAFRQPFPASQYPPCIVAAPVYHPGIDQFQDPISYIESVRGDAESYGMCVIVPPEGWQPECNVSEDLRFTTQVQHVHKMQNRWGPNVVHLECIKKHLESQGRKVEQHPLVGGIELDIPALHNTIVKFGGLQQVIDKCKWPRVADSLNVPKSALERTTRLYDAYCKYLLSYDMLSEEDKARLRQQVLTMAGKKSHIQQQDCFTKGKSRTLGEFFRIARNTTAMWFANEQPTTEQVEAKYWSLVSEASQHVSVQTAHVDTSSCGSAFPSRKDSPYYRHGWNFNELQHNSGSLLQYIGQVADVSVPTLHINMLFSTGCLSRDLHLLPYVHYLHSGEDIIWYCVPSSEEDKLRTVVKKLCPGLVDTSDPVWLSDDTIMLSPDLLKQHGLSVCRCVQKQGQYAVIFPGAFTAWVSCGYNIAESLRFATPSWIHLGKKAAKMLMESCEPDLFSVDRLLLTLARLHKMPLDLLTQTLPHLRETINNELLLRKQLATAGLKSSDRLPDDFSLTSARQRRSFELTDLDENRCEVCKRTCYLSMVMNETEDVIYCLLHALTHIEKKRNLRACRFLYRFTEEDLAGILEQAKNRRQTSSPTKNKSPKMKT